MVGLAHEVRVCEPQAARLVDEADGHKSL